VCLTKSSIIEYNLDSELSDIYTIPGDEIKDIFITKAGKYILVKRDSISITDDYKEQGVEFYKADKTINVATYDDNTGNLIIALSDGKIFYWKNIQYELEEPTLLGDIPDGKWGAISFNSQNNIVAAGTGLGGGGTIYLWDITTGNQTTSLTGHTTWITRISFSSDGSLMASASRDGSVVLWQIDDLNTLPIVFDDHANWVTAVEFTSDDKYVMSGVRNGNLKALPTEIGTIINDYCGYLSRDLTENEWQNYVALDIDYKPAKCTN
jgi:WD40 repeat protein